MCPNAHESVCVCHICIIISEAFSVHEIDKKTTLRNLNRLKVFDCREHTCTVIDVVTFELLTRISLHSAFCNSAVDKSLKKIYCMFEDRVIEMHH